MDSKIYMTAVDRIWEFPGDITVADQDLASKIFNERRLKMTITPDDDDFEKWIAIAVDSQFEELDLTFSGLRLFKSHMRKNNTLPQTLYASTSLKSLILVSCNLEYPMSPLRFTSLRNISFFHVELDDRTLDCLVASCPLIESFSLNHVRVLKQVKISGLHYLKNLEMVCSDQEPLEKVHIDANALQTFKCWGRRNINIQWNIRTTSTLKELLFDNVNITDPILDEIIANSPLITRLKLANCNKLQKLKISSVGLEAIQIEKCNQMVQVCIDAPNLQSFWYWGKILLSFTTKHSPLCSARIHFTDAFSFLKWQQFLSDSARFYCIELTIDTILEEGLLTEEASSPTLCEMKHLELVIPAAAGLQPWRYAAFLDGLLRSCKSKTLTIKDALFFPEDLSMDLRRRLKERPSSHCHIIHHKRCKGHYVKDFQIAYEQKQILTTCKQLFIRIRLHWGSQKSRELIRMLCMCLASGGSERRIED